jgi:hypothetical protein
MHESTNHRFGPRASTQNLSAILPLSQPLHGGYAFLKRAAAKPTLFENVAIAIDYAHLKDRLVKVGADEVLDGFVHESAPVLWCLCGDQHVECPLADADFIYTFHSASAVTERSDSFCERAVRGMKRKR